jgi:hypothetical protein
VPAAHRAVTVTPRCVPKFASGVVTASTVTAGNAASAAQGSAIAAAATVAHVRTSVRRP